MPYYRAAGNIPPKRHTQHRAPDGSLYYEELMGEEGFSSDSSLLYHAHIPSAVVDVRPWDLPDQSLTPNYPLAPRHLSTHALFKDDVSQYDAVTDRRLLLGNADVRLSYVVAAAPSPYYRNAIGDECLYVEAGEAVVESVFGDLPVGPGDYAIIPRATTYLVVPRGPVPAAAGSGSARHAAASCQPEQALPAERSVREGHRHPQPVAGISGPAVSSLREPTGHQAGHGSGASRSTRASPVHGGALLGPRRVEPPCHDAWPASRKTAPGSVTSSVVVLNR